MIKKEGGLKWELKEVWALPEVNFFLTSDNSHFTTPSFLKQNKTKHVRILHNYFAYTI